MSCVQVWVLYLTRIGAKKGDMKNLIISIALSFFVLNVSSLTYAAEAVQMPVAKDGDRWEFKAVTKDSSSSSTDRLNGNYEVAYVKGQLEVFEVVDGQKVGVGHDSTAFLKRMLGFAQDEQQYLKFPLAIGNTWAADYSVRAPGAKKAQQRSAEFKVQDKAQTKTAAGIFETLNIKGSNIGGTAPRAWEYSYSPNCKCVVKFFYDSVVGGVGGKVEIELVKFTPSSS